MNKKYILNFIKTLRESFYNCEEVYTNGGCYQFYLILKSLFKNSTCWYSIYEGHVYVEINGIFYDIKGEHHFNEKWIHIEDEPNILKQAKNWRYGKY